MNEEFKINTYYCKDGEDLEKILINYLITILNNKTPEIVNKNKI